MYVCTGIMYVFIGMYNWTRMYACMYVTMYMYVHVCMYVCTIYTICM